MSGHNKWSSIKHKKAAVDSKRGKIFTKLIREITVAAKTGGGDIEANPTLRLAVSKAKEANMPADNIARAIKKGSGDQNSENYEEQLYEGYGPGGVGILVRALTDNKNRTAADVRSLFTKRNGSMAGPGAVSYQFQHKGFFVISKDVISEEDLFMIVTEAGAEDLSVQQETYEVLTTMENFDSVRKELDKKGIKCEKAELSLIPDNTIPVNDIETAKKISSLIEMLEDHDDVQSVYDNSDIPDDILNNL